MPILKVVIYIPKNLHMKFGEGRVIGLKMRALQSCINMAIFQKKSSKIPFFKWEKNSPGQIRWNWGLKTCHSRQNQKLKSITCRQNFNPTRGLWVQLCSLTRGHFWTLSLVFGHNWILMKESTMVFISISLVFWLWWWYVFQTCWNMLPAP